MKESIYIKNFGPIVEASIDDIKPYTFFIGESGSGKSTILKVTAFFRWIYKMMCIRSYLKYSGLKKSPFRIIFNSHMRDMGLKGYLRSNTTIKYQFGDSIIEYSDKTLKGVNKFVEKRDLSLEKLSFISDKRNIIGDMLENNVSVRKRSFYLSETYEDYIRAVDDIEQYDIEDLGIRFVVKKTPIGLKHMIEPITADGYGYKYAINLNESSSGIQAVIPLSLIAEYFFTKYDIIDSLNNAIFSYVMRGDSLKDFRATMNIGEFNYKRVHLFVEEPEISLYPDNQIALMDRLIFGCSLPKDYCVTLMIATHSPYIINYLNVILRRNKDSGKAWLSGKDLAVYGVYEGRLQNLVGTDSITNRVIVNTSDLSEVIKDIYNEYCSYDEK